MSHSHFSLISSEYLPTLDVTLEYYEHNRTKAKHVHFASKNIENVFMVALRTMPHDSTGVAHILEHTALCGSKNFPVRDPFFGMLKRSMQTFMNAFTSSDWTAYPFATENKQDFDNLLRVYLDAVFFPNLDKLDFMQEGHRFDFDENGDLVIKGVVYNEMKGVYGNAFERIYETNKSLLHPETTYHYDSGGAPQVIPRLTYDNFIAFHKKHYHPTNATFMTFGDIPASEHQEKFENLVLKHFDYEGEKVTTDDETRYLGPQQSTQYYPSTDTENPHQTHILFSWLLESASNTAQHLEANLVYSYLLGHSGSPLRHALENYEHAASISPLTMLDDSGREIRFVTGIVTDDAKWANDCEKLIFDTLEQVVKNGVETREAIGILDSIEMSLRELNTGYPYGLSLMLQAIGAVTHEQDISLMLDPSPLLDTLREKVQNPHYIGELIQKLLIDNAHRTRLTMIPSAKASEVEQNLEKNFCKKILEKLSETEIAEIKENAKKLEEHQKKPQNMDLLPKIELSDIPRESKKMPMRHVSDSAISYEVITNKLEYIKSYFPISSLTEEEIPFYALAAGLYGELGFDGMNYVDAQKKIAEKMNFSSSFSLFTQFGDANIRAYFSAHSRFLDRNSSDAKNIFAKILQSPKFDEIEQIRNIFSEKILGLKSSLTSAGNATAMLRASSGHNFLAHISEKLGGIESLSLLKKFVKKSDNEIIENFEKISHRLTSEKPIQITISSEKIPENFVKTQEENIAEKFTPIAFSSFQKHRVNEAWLADLAVGYCAYSLKAVSADHKDAPLFALLTQFLRDGYLHSAIREQGGAYGAGAKYDPISESFNFFSYRDPRIEGTFEDFEKSIAWLLENNHDEERLDEAKIGVIARIDTPTSPAKMAASDVMRVLRKITTEDEDRHRKTILDATIDDLKCIAREYLSDFSEASRVVITGKQNQEICEKMGFEIHTLD